MKQDTPLDGQDRLTLPVDLALPGGKRSLLWIGLALLAVAGAGYLVWKRWQRWPRAQVESALPVRPERLVVLPREVRPQNASLSDESDSKARWASLPVILLGTAIITAVVTVLLLLFLDRPAFFGLEFDLPQFGGSVFRTYQQQPLPIPVLQRSPAEDVAELTAQKVERLKSYGWVEEEGIAHIPIERAMRLLIEQGLPASETRP